jgi:hypothetical protein
MQPSVSPGLNRMHSGYDDTAYSDVVSAFETQTNYEAQEPEAAIDRDNKLLSFSPPSFEHVLLDYAFRSTSISLSAQLHGMFFLAESPWAATGDASTPQPTELTCYRRNLFQITGNITLPRNLRCILTDQGEQLPIIGQELTVSATESTEGNPVKIISVPWKTSTNPPQPAPEDKGEREPPSIPLDLMNVQDMESEFAQLPFQWKRLQFRIATANNGRRKELQQHFVIRLKVIATLANGTKMPICEVGSGPVIVRGRSPRNFQSRKDTPLNANASHSRKNTVNQRTTSADSVAKANQAAGNGNGNNNGNGVGTAVSTAHIPQVKTEAPQPPASLHSFFDPNDFNGVQDMYDGILRNPVQPQGSRTMVPQEPFSYERQRGYVASSPDLGRATSKTPLPPSAPINLSLVEDEPAITTPTATTTAMNAPPPRPESSSIPPRNSVTPSKRPIMPPPRPPSFSINTVSTPDESADLLYEYFPLGLDEWQPPVDAVYRPHVVHHIKVSTDPRDPNVGVARGRSKRYFSEVAG